MSRSIGARLRRLLPLLAASITLPLWAQQSAPQLVGGFKLGSDWQLIRMRIPADSSRTTIDLPQPDACTMGVPVEGLARSGSDLRFEVKSGSGRIRFSGSVAPDGSISGMVMQGDQRGAFRLARLVALDPQKSTAYAGYVGNYRLPTGRTLLITEIDGLPVYLDSLRFAKLFPLSETTFFTDDGERITFDPPRDGVAPAFELEAWDGNRSRATRVTLYREERLSYPNGGIRLGGTVLTPSGKGPFPAVVMVHGSNVQPREGYRFLGGDYFARHGIATLIYDKRGVGESGGKWLGAPLDTLAGDALAGVQLLQGRPDIDRRRIGLYGISQGGWIIPLAGARSSDVAFLISVSGNVIKLWEQETLRQLGEMRARRVAEAVVAQADTTFRLFYRLLEAGQGTQQADAAIDRLRQHRVPTPPKSTEIGANVWFKFLDPFYDPMLVLERVRQPILWIFGEVDLITPPKPNLDRLEPLLRRTPRPNYTIKVFPKGNHMIWRGVTGSGLEIPCLRDVDPGYFTTMVDWIRAIKPR